MQAVPTMSDAGRADVVLQRQGQPLAPLPPADRRRRSTAQFKVDKDGFYRIELDAPTGRARDRVAAVHHRRARPISRRRCRLPSPAATPRRRRSKKCSSRRARRTTSASRIWTSCYSVNGGAEKTIRLFDGKKRLPKCHGRAHVLSRGARRASPATSCRTTRKRRRQRRRAGREAGDERHVLPAGPSAAARSSAARSRTPAAAAVAAAAGRTRSARCREQQRQIIAATFNVQRDRKKMTADKLRENSTVHRAVAVAAARPGRRAADADEQPAGASRIPRSRRLRSCCRRRSTEMKNAEAKLHAVSPEARSRPSRRRCSILQKAEEEYEMQVRSSASRVAAAAGAAARWRRISPTCSRWSSTRWRTSTRPRQQRRSSSSRDQKLDELMEKLKELARRQEQEAERQRRRARWASRRPAADRASQQRELADQAEEAARRLEQLSREENRPELMQSARQLREAADAMRRAAANGSRPRRRRRRPRSSGCRKRSASCSRRSPAAPSAT